MEGNASQSHQKGATQLQRQYAPLVAGLVASLSESEELSDELSESLSESLSLPLDDDSEDACAPQPRQTRTMNPQRQTR